MVSSHPLFRRVVTTCTIGVALAALTGTGLAQAQPTPAPAVSPTSGVTSGSIEGIVRSDRGPVSGAVVKIHGTATQSVTTGADGVFRFDGLAAGTYRVTASAPGYQPLGDTTVTTGPGNPQEISVTLASASLQSLRTIASTSVTGRGALTVNTSGAALSTITSQDFIDRGQAQVTDLLEEQPGVELARFDSSAPGSNAVVSVRGAAPYETQVLIDGHPVTGGGYGDFLIQFLNPLVLGSIEVDKGPGVFGNTIADAIGGTVNFRTPSITNTLQGRLTSGYDSYNGSTYSARVSDTFGKLGFLAAYGFNGTPGYFDGNILSVTAAGNAQAGSIPNAVVNTSIPASETFQNRSQVFKLNYNFSPTTSLTLGSIGEQSYVDYTATLDSVEPVTIVGCLTTPCTGPYNNPGYGGLIGKTVLASNTYDALYLGNYEYDNEPIFTADFRTSIGPGSFLGRYYTGGITRNIDDPEEAQQVTACNNPSCTMASFSTPYYETEVDHLRGEDFEYSLPFARDGQDIAQVSYDDHSDTSLDCSGASADFKTQANCTNGVFNLLQTSRTFSVRALANVLPKVRVGFANYFSDTTFVGARYDPRATLVWTPKKSTALRFAVGTSYVAPPANLVAPIPGSNKAVANGTLYVSDALHPETSAGVDIGADFAVHGDSKFSFDVYRTALTDRFSTLGIQPNYAVPAGSSFGVYNGMPFNKISEIYNASDSNEEGIEFGFVRAPRVGFGAIANLDLLRAYNYNTSLPVFPGATIGGASGSSNGQTGAISGDGFETPGFQIPGYANSHARLQVSYKFANTANLAFGQTVYGANNSFGEPGFSIFDFDANVPLNYGLRMSASVSNLFNHDGNRTLSEYAYGYTPPGEGTPYDLLFAPPRVINFQLIYPFGGR